jgi:hypothetical protein
MGSGSLGQRPAPVASPAPEQPRPGRYRLAIVSVITFGLVLGALIVRSYGISTDEYIEADLGADALKAYSGSPDYFHDISLENHGPVYFMFSSIASEVFVRIIPQWTAADGRHFTNYLMFLAGVLCFYWICLRLMHRPSAVWATALFATQPLLFGSSFINQKDIPFMTLFLAVVALGFSAGEGSKQVAEPDRAHTPQDLKQVIGEYLVRWRTRWQTLERGRQRIILATLLLGLLLLADLFFVGVLHQMGESILVAAYDGRAPSPIQALYARIATDAYKTPLALYVERYNSLFAAVRFVVTGLYAALLVVAYRVVYVAHDQSSEVPWPGERYLPLAVGGALLGAAICVRQIGLFAGGLVSLYLFVRAGRKSIIPLLLYWSMAALVMYATWPYLWSDPVKGIANSLLAIQDVGHHDVLFQGLQLDSFIVPPTYVPVLLVLELTEPAVVLTFLGALVLLWRSVMRRTDGLVASVVALWAAVPVGWQIIGRVPVFNNLRLFLFVIPALMLIAGVGLEALFGRMTRPWLRGLLLSLAIAPGVWGVLWLHPYEYTYFNTGAGGVSGAYGNYDLDYWCTSLKEATEVINQIAPSGDTVQVFGSLQNAAPYARADLKLIDRFASTAEANTIALCTHKGDRWRDTVGFSKVYEVRRGDAVFAEVWRRQAATVDTAAAR